MLRNKFTPHLLSIGLFLLLTVLLTWPLVAKITSAVPTVDPWMIGDPNMYIWWSDWIAKAITGAHPVSPELMVFWPNGISPWAGYDGPLMLVIGVPVTLISKNPILAYNIYILSTLWAASLAAYGLVYKLTRSYYASILAGGMFGLSPYILVRSLLHPNLLMIFVIPLMIWAALNLLERPSVKRDFVLWGAILLSALSSWYYLIGGLVFLALFGLWHHRKLWKHKMIALLTAIIIVVACILPALPIILSDTGGGEPESDFYVNTLGARAANLVIPHPYTTIFGTSTMGAYDGFMDLWRGPLAWESTSYLGAIIIGMMIIFFIYRRHWKKHNPWFWSSSAVLFFMLAMGNYVEILGTRIPLPFQFIRHLFPFSLARAPNRFFIFTLMAATVMAGFVLAYLAKKLKKKHLILFSIPLVALLLAERAILPYPVTVPEIPEFYKTIATDQENYAIVDLPIYYPGYNLYNHYQMTHNHPLVDGEYFYPTYSKKTFSYLKSNPLLAASYCRGNAKISRPIDHQLVFEDFHNNNVRYVIVHNLILQNDWTCETPTENIRSFFRDIEHIYADGTITVYRVPSPTESDGQL